MRPGEVTASEDSVKVDRLPQKRFSRESGLYATNTWKASNKLNVTYGVRISNFNVLGKGDFYTVNNEGTIIDTTSYKKGQTVKSYLNPEPRLAAGYQFDNNTSVKASYVRNVQYMHLINNSSGGFSLLSGSAAASI